MVGGEGSLKGNKKVCLSSSATSPTTGKVSLAEGLLGSATVSSIAGSLLVSGLGVLNNISGGIISSNRGGVGRGVAGLGVGGGGSINFGTLSGDIVVQAVQSLGLGAVKVEPPVTDEVVLVKHGSVGAEEAVLGKTTLAVGCANVENLALSLGVGVVSSVHLTVTGESGLRCFGIDGVVFTGDTGDSLLQHGKVVVSSSSVGLILVLSSGIVGRLRLAWAGISLISARGRVSRAIAATAGSLTSATALGCNCSKKDKG